MTMRIWLGAAAAIASVLTVGLVAQTSRGVAKPISLTGCMQRAWPSPTGTAGTSAASATATRFLLTNTSMKSTGTTDRSEPSTAPANEYRLDADDAKLTAHVGHKVEIAGTVEEPIRMMPNPPPPTASPAASAPKLRVDTVRMISSNCP